MVVIWNNSTRYLCCTHSVYDLAAWYVRRTRKGLGTSCSEVLNTIHLGLINAWRKSITRKGSWTASVHHAVAMISKYNLMFYFGPLRLDFVPLLASFHLVVVGLQLCKTRRDLTVIGKSATFGVSSTHQRMQLSKFSPSNRNFAFAVGCPRSLLAAHWREAQPRREACDPQSVCPSLVAGINHLTFEPFSVNTLLVHSVRY